MVLNNLCTGETREGGATLGWCHQGGRLERKLWVVMDLMMFSIQRILFCSRHLCQYLGFRRENWGTVE